MFLLRLLAICGPLLLLGAGGFGYYTVYYRPAELEQTVRGIGVPFGFPELAVDVGPGETSYQGRSEYRQLAATGPSDVYRPVENTAQWASGIGFPFDPRRIDQCYLNGCTMQRVVDGHDVRITLRAVLVTSGGTYTIDLRVEY